MVGTAYILCVGHDRMLLNTRRWILEALYSVEIAETLSDATEKIATTQFDLVILCQSLSEEERRYLDAFVHMKNPKTKILRMLSAELDGHANGDGLADGAKAAPGPKLVPPPLPPRDEHELQATDGPRGLLKKTLEMLPHGQRHSRQHPRPVSQ